MSSACRRDEKGLTLIELIAVVSVIGAAAAIAAPRIMDIRPAIEVNAATRQIVSEMLFLKVRAISENRKYRMIFGKIKENQYQIQQDGNRDDDYSDAVDTIVKTGTLPSTIIFGTNASKRTSGSPMCSGGVCFGSYRSASFKPTGTADSGSLYLMPREDMWRGRNDRMRGISIDSAARVKAWRYSGGSPQWKSF